MGGGDGWAAQELGKPLLPVRMDCLTKSFSQPAHFSSLCLSPVCKHTNTNAQMKSLISFCLSLCFTWISTEQRRIGSFGVFD